MSKIKVEIQKQKVSELKNHEDNPRVIRDKKYKELLKSIDDFGEMLDIREIVVDEENIVLGGNMRLKALQELGIKEVTVKKVLGLTEKQKREFVIKDNVNFGEWDWDNLANEWTASELNDWGVGVWENKTETKEFEPTMFPEQVTKEITEEDIQKGREGMGSTFQKGTEKKFIGTMCPECGHEFNVIQE